jgi:hypothetical protein
MGLFGMRGRTNSGGFSRLLRYAHQARHNEQDNDREERNPIKLQEGSSLRRISYRSKRISRLHRLSQKVLSIPK